MGLRVAVTGTSGFIGGHLARLLSAEGYEVLGVDNRVPSAPPAGWDDALVDILDEDRLGQVLREFGPECVVHLAARTDLDETASGVGYAANTIGVANLVRAIHNAATVRRAICTSSQLVCRLGYTPSSPHDYAPTTAYGRSKVETERIWRAADGGGTEWCIVRPTTVWGPGMGKHYLRFFELVAKGRYVHIGAKPIWKSYAYVGNVVHQLRELLGAPSAMIERKVFYLADYEPIALQAWCDAFQVALDAPPIRRVPTAVARAVAGLGDAIVALGAKEFPFTSFRLGNVLTPSVVRVSDTADVCGPLPYTMEDGVFETAAWLRGLWRRE